jgi:hypothetical protein
VNPSRAEEFKVSRTRRLGQAVFCFERQLSGIEEEENPEQARLPRGSEKILSRKARIRGLDKSCAAKYN